MEILEGSVINGETINEFGLPLTAGTILEALGFKPEEGTGQTLSTIERFLMTGRLVSVVNHPLQQIPQVNTLYGGPEGGAGDWELAGVLALRPIELVDKFMHPALKKGGSQFQLDVYKGDAPEVRRYRDMFEKIGYLQDINQFPSLSSARIIISVDQKGTVSEFVIARRPNNTAYEQEILYTIEGGKNKRQWISYPLERVFKARGKGFKYSRVKGEKGTYSSINELQATIPGIVWPI